VRAFNLGQSVLAWCRCGKTVRAASAALALGAGLATPVAAQDLGAVLGLARPAAADVAAASASPATDDTALRAKLTQELEVARKLLGKTGSMSWAPAGVGEAEFALVVRKLQQWVHALEVQIRAIEGLKSSTQDLSQAETAGAADIASLQREAHISILRVEEIAQEVHALEGRIAAASALQQMNTQALKPVQDEMERDLQTQRRAEDTARNQPDDALTQWRAQAAGWMARSSGASVASMLAEHTFDLSKAELDRARLKVLTVKLQLARAHKSFTQDDLEHIKNTSALRQAQLEKAATAASKAQQQNARSAALAEKALQALREATPPSTQASLELAQAELDALNAAVETARLNSEMLPQLSSLDAAMVLAWQARFAALNASGAAQREEASRHIGDFLASLKVWRNFAQGQLALVQAEQAQQHERVSADPKTLHFDGLRRASLQERAIHAQQLMQQVEQDTAILQRWVSQIALERAEQTWPERAAFVWVKTLELGRTVWNFELFAVEDSIEVNGQKVTSTRGVTVGKSVGALVLFLVGYLIARRLVYRLERLLIARFGLEAQQARTVRRWTLTSFAFALAAVTLNVAQIPLTVFAFFGGALAIGVGFGTQTIIKNFVSGLILLTERKIHVGDTVNVDGFIGTVTEISLRSSTLTGVDGIEAIIPNSNLLEGRVSNWTMGDWRLRRSLRVGVAYGSKPRQVAELLQECASRHGLVLQEPAPQVVFEDFADSTLNFMLHFWIDLKCGRSGELITSDLRFMVDESFAAAGVAMAFPQRDVHLHSLQPLRVEIGRPQVSQGV
jgi:small-conductance mechanosensitive channel